MKEFVYQLDNASNGVSEILAINLTTNKTEFLVLERDSKSGAAARVKRIYRVSIANASDVSSVPFMSCCELPQGVTAVTKALYLDLLDPEYGLAGESFPEKPEGMTFGPVLPNGRRLFLVATDNDFVATSPTMIYAFEVPTGH